MQTHVGAGALNINCV